MSDNSVRYSQQELHIPFGRYEASAPASPPDHRILVGRTKERARLIDWLLARGNRGAFLITGARGVGKTSFVRSCLEDYRQAILERFLLCGSARGFFFGQLQLAAALAVLVIAPISASYLAAVAWHAEWAINRLWTGPLLLIAAMPGIHAGRTWWAMLREGAFVRKEKKATPTTRFFCASLLTPLAPMLLSLASLHSFWWTGSRDRLWDLWGIGAVILVFWLVYALEFLLIVRPSVKSPGRPEHPWVRMRHRFTFFSVLYETWLPVLRVDVNLGFDELDHTLVVRAMLTGLRDAYYRHFVSAVSRLGLIFRVGGATMLLFGTFVLSDVMDAKSLHWLGLDLKCSSMDARSAPSKLQALWCARIVQIELRVPGYSISPTSLPRAFDLLLPQESQDGAELRRYVLRGYHLAMLLVLWLSIRTLFQRTGPARYRYLHRRLNRILRGLDSSTRELRTGTKFELAGSLVKFQSAGPDTQVETPKLDPRQVELQLLEVLRDVDRRAFPLPVGMEIFIPGAEVFFVLDELDKVGSRHFSAPPRDRSLADSANTIADSHFGSDRNRQLHRLLSELKNLFSTAQGRFIFIGGRDLDDEWLADRTARQPLLSTVFDGELYLPSLLVDESFGPSALDGSAHLKGTSAYLRAQTLTAEARRNGQERRLGCTLRDRARLASDWDSQQPGPTSPDTEAQLDWTPVNGASAAGTSLPLQTAPAFRQQFLRYLAVVGRGNPKRLATLLDEFVRPTGEAASHRHRLVFSHTDRFRIALVSEVYEKIKPVIAARTEDKVVQCAFYLAEFLFKFHRRAFQWSSLERLDELLDVHHAPDLRQLLASIVRAWSQSYLAVTANGMYAFRFNSALAAEIRYISRKSSSEMASFNFTLDETYLLKQEYDRRLRVARERNEDQFLARSALGELYDFDEDYEQARHHYLAAVRSLDEALNREYQGYVLHVAGILQKPTDSAEKADPDQAGIQARAQVNWSIPRLFTKLQIGLTYERAREFGNAYVHYCNARSLGEGVIAALLAGNSAAGRARDDGPWVETLKQMNVLWQPGFACAWVAEKSNHSASSGSRMIRKLIQTTYQFLGRFAKEEPFCLTLADVHQAAGTFYFMRGKAHLALARTEYALGIQQIRRYLASPYHAAQEGRAIDLRLQSDVVTRRLSTALLSLADVYYAQTWSADLATCEVAVPDEVSLAKLKQWLLNPRERSQTDLPDSEDARYVTMLGDFARCSDRQPPGVGADPQQTDRDRSAVFHDQTLAGKPALQAYLTLSELAAQVLDEGGYHEEAAQEHLQTARSLVTILWSIRSARRVPGGSPDGSAPGLSAPSLAFGQSLGTYATYALQEAGRTRHSSIVDLTPNIERLRAALALALAQVPPEPSLAILRNCTRDRPYPVLSVLTCLRTMVLSRVLAEPEVSTDHEPTKANVEELRLLNAEYDSPAHFTPFSYGSTLALWTLRPGTIDGRLKAEPYEQEIAEDALGALRTSQGTYKQQRAYYELISGIYYLDDGFNDREIHTRHACQMFADPLTSALIKRLEELLTAARKATGDPESLPKSDLLEPPVDGERPPHAQA